MQLLSVFDELADNSHHTPLIHETSRSFHFSRVSHRSISKQKMGAYDFQVFSADGNLVDLGKYRGHVTLIVNTSCFDEKARSSYQLLATVHQKYKDEDLSVLLFPCSQFGSGQTTAEIEADYLQKTNLTNAGTLFKEVDVGIQEMLLSNVHFNIATFSR